MQIVIDIDENVIESAKSSPNYYPTYNFEKIWRAIANGTPLDEKELKLKRWIEKDIKMLNEIIESGWLISDLEKCPAIDACEDAITALKQYPVLDKIRAEIEQKARPNEIGGRGNGKSIRYGLCMALEIIDKYRGNVDAI